MEESGKQTSPSGRCLGWTAAPRLPGLLCEGLSLLCAVTEYLSRGNLQTTDSPLISGGPKSKVGGPASEEPSSWVPPWWRAEGSVHTSV